MDKTIAKMVDFCERIELTKELPTVKKTSHKKTGRDHSKSGKKEARGNFKHLQLHVVWTKQNSQY